MSEYLAAACLLAAGVSGLSAQTLVSTEAEYHESGVLLAFDDDSSTSSSFSYAGGGNGYGSAYSSSNGILNVAARTNSDIAMMSFSFSEPFGELTSASTAIWQDTVTNNTGEWIDYRYIFHVDNPRLGISGDAGDYAGLAFDIKLNGSSLWSALIEMDTGGLSHSSNIASPISGGGNAATFASFDAAVPLGAFAPGASFTITYEMEAFANAATRNGTSYAAVGDPAFPEGTPLQVVSEVVPEPGTVTLFGLALAGAGFVRRRRMS